MDSLRVGQTGTINGTNITQNDTVKTMAGDTNILFLSNVAPTCQSLPVPQSGLHDFLEEPTFIPPTKRQTDKPGRTKPKEKKENCKQQ